MVDGIDLQNDVLEEVEPLTRGDIERFKSDWGKFDWASSAWELPGQNPEATSSSCGKSIMWHGCLGGEGGEGHNHVDLLGHDFHGKVVVQRVRMSCDSFRCPVCAPSAARREALKMEARLFEASKRWGKVEHIVVSLPVKDYGIKGFAYVRAKVEKVLFSRGVVGGAIVFHPARYDEVRHWYFSAHFHALAFIAGGYGCRGCKKYCLAHPECDGMEGRVRRLREKDGYIVKVLGARGKRWSSYVMDGEKVKVVSGEDNVFGTARYELGHVGLPVGGKRVRVNVVTYFGVCSYRKLKVSVKLRKSLCPICAEPFVPLDGVGLIGDIPSGDGVFVVDGLDSSGECRFREKVVDSGW